MNLEFQTFICVDDVTYVETQANHSKLGNFISSRKTIKNAVKLCVWFFFIKSILKMQRKEQNNRNDALSLICYANKCNSDLCFNVGKYN